MRARILGVVLVGGVLASGAAPGCGYQVGGLYPELDVQVATFDNVSERRTLEFELTNAVVHEMIARGFRVNKPGSPLVLRGRILDVRTPPLVGQPDTDAVLVSSIAVRVEVSLTDAQGHERWKEERLEHVPFTPSRAEDFDTARVKAFDRIARWVVTRFEKEW